MLKSWEHFRHMTDFRVLISELGAESDFELIDDDDMPMYPGETCPGKYLSTKPTGVNELNT